MTIANHRAEQREDQEAKYKNVYEQRPKDASSPAMQMLTRAFDSSDSDYDLVLAIGRIINSHPQWTDEIVAFLNNQTTLGNGFVTRVLSQIRQTAPAAKAPEGGGKFAKMLAEDGQELDPRAPTAESSKGAAAPAPEAAKPQMDSAAQVAPPAPTGGKSNAVVDAVKMDMLQTTHAEGGAAGAANAGAPTAESSKDAAAPAPEAAKPQIDSAAQAAPPAPVAESKKEPAAEQAPPPKQEVGSASQTPVPAPPAPTQESKKEPAAAAPVPDAAPPVQQGVASAAQESAPKTDEKSAIEKGQEEKPQDKADGEVKITASALRVRAEASFSGKVIGKIPRGGKATVKGQHGVWLEIVWHGGSGFIHSKYTTGVKGNESGEEEEQEHQAQDSHEQKQERPKAPPVPTTDDQQKAVV